jgi:hypothetical protein
MAPVCEWLSAMTVLYGQAIAALLRRRDAIVARRAAHDRRESFFEDRSVDVITETRISLGHRLPAWPDLPAHECLFSEEISHAFADSPPGGTCHRPDRRTGRRGPLPGPVVDTHGSRRIWTRFRWSTCARASSRS